MKQQPRPGLGRIDALEQDGQNSTRSAFHTGRVEAAHLLAASGSARLGVPSSSEQFAIAGDTGREVRDHEVNAERHGLSRRSEWRMPCGRGAERGPPLGRGRLATMSRPAAAVVIALLIANLLTTPASAHYVQPPGEEEA